MVLKKKVLNKIKVYDRLVPRRLHALIETKNGDFFVVIRGNLISKCTYDGTIIYQQNRLYVKRAEWVFDSYNISPINDFKNKQYKEELRYKVVLKGEEIKCYAEFCNNVRRTYGFNTAKVVKKIRENLQKPEKIIISYEYLMNPIEIKKLNDLKLLLNIKKLD